MRSTPLISIVIPTKQINSNLTDENFPAINNLNFEKFEVIVLTDEYSKNEKNLLKKYPWLKIVFIKQEMRPAEKRNLGVKIAKGEIIAFIDDDAYPSKDWLTNAISLLQQAPQPPRLRTLPQQSKIPIKSVSAVCGPGILPKKTNLWEKVFDEVLKSWIGSGGYSYRFVKQKKRTVDDYPSMNFLIKKDVFNKLGGFNNNYWPGEDSKLCEDIVYKEKRTILYDPSVFVYHHRRNNLPAFIKQHANYGFHRGAFFAHGDQNSRRLSYLIPTIFTLYLLLSTFYFLSSKFYHLPSTIYLPLIIYLLLAVYLFFRSLINTHDFLISFLSPFVLFLTHISYGIMFIKGLIIGLIKKDRIYN